MRAAGGVQPTPKAQRLATPVRQALATLEQALGEVRGLRTRPLRTHLPHPHERHRRGPLPRRADGGAARGAPGVRVETRPLPREQIAEALDGGASTSPSASCPWSRTPSACKPLEDRYVVLLREAILHARAAPARRCWTGCASWSSWPCARTRTPCASLRQMRLEDRLRLVTEHFMVLPLDREGDRPGGHDAAQHRAGLRRAATRWWSRPGSRSATSWCRCTGAGASSGPGQPLAARRDGRAVRE